MIYRQFRHGLEPFCKALKNLRAKKRCPVEHCGGMLWAERSVYPEVLIISCDKGHSWEAAVKEIKDVKACLRQMSQEVREVAPGGGGDFLFKDR